VKFFEGAETHRDEWVVPFLLLGLFKLFPAIWTYEKGQKVAEGT
jgi:hypothetical protein